jgi:large subunit ribosomal protein L21
MMYAIFETGGKQYRVEPRGSVRVEKLNAEVGQTLEFDRVLLVGTDQGVTVGQPVVSGAKIMARVAEQGRGPKIYVQKFKRRKKYRRRTGHRQSFTRLLVTDIILTAGGEPV